MKVKCIKETDFFDLGKIYNVKVDKQDIFSYKMSTVNSAIIELYTDNITIAQVMYRFFRKDPINCWYFDNYFKTHFEILA